MSIVYREDKGSPLTIEELDGNFRDLDQRLLRFEDGQREGQIQRIEMKGNELIFIDPFGKIVATVLIPILRFNPKGLWAANQNYAINDIVSHENICFVCIKAHHAGIFEMDCWQKLFDLPKADVLSIYQSQNLPLQPERGQMILVAGQNHQYFPVYWSGQNWINMSTNEILKEI